jgi:hypothetical protein
MAKISQGQRNHVLSRIRELAYEKRVKDHSEAIKESRRKHVREVIKLNRLAKEMNSVLKAGGAHQLVKEDWTKQFDPEFRDISPPDISHFEDKVMLGGSDELLSILGEATKDLTR